MIVPEFWAQGRIQEKRDGRQITVKRFGWSDESSEAAQRHADDRTREAFARVAAGEKLKRWETKVPYVGDEGLPIREEIVARHGDTVITRNSYGAQCLNTPDVLFADVDYDYASMRLQRTPSCGLVWLIPAVGLVCGIWGRSGWSGLGAAAVTAVLLSLVFYFLTVYPVWRAGGWKKFVRNRIDSTLRSFPEWRLRLYETPAGLRIMAIHKLFDPTSEEVQAFFEGIGVDYNFSNLCRAQRCFRARLTAKPWRIGFRHMTPRPGTWPINPKRLAERQAWVREYEQAAEAYASCRFADEIGSGKVDPKAQAVVRLHDDLCRSSTPLPIA